MFAAIVSKVLAGLLVLVVGQSNMDAVLARPSGSTQLPSTGQESAMVVTKEDIGPAYFLLVDMPDAMSHAAPLAVSAGVVLAAAYGVAVEKERRG